jgi:multisubunit Na+/H+ antiporter MnhF subunit
VRHQAVFLAGITWLAVLLGVAVLWIWRARTTAERLVALDAAVLVLVGLLGLVAGEEQRSYPLDAAARYLGDRRPFEQPDQPAEGPPP